MPVGKSGLVVFLCELWLPVPYAGASLLLYNVVNRASQIYRLRVWQYVVFIIKLVLSYLPVYLTDSLPSPL